MPTFESLKAEHLEWCWNCEEMRAHRQPCAFRPHPVISALTAAKLEDEATIAELRDDLEREQAALHLKETYRKGVESELAASRVMIQDKDARIAELEDLRWQDAQAFLRKCAECDDLTGNNINLAAQLRSEQAAHAATKEELRKADETIQQQARELEEADAIVIFRVDLDDGDFDSPFEEKVYRAALARIQAQRAAEHEETK